MNNSFTNFYSLLNDINEYPLHESKKSYTCETRKEKKAYQLEHQQALDEWQAYMDWLNS